MPDEDIAYIRSKLGDDFGRRFAIPGGYPKQTILRHVENLCYKNDSLRDTLFSDLMRVATEEEEVTHAPRVPQVQTNLNPQQEIVDLTWSSPGSERQCKGRKRKSGADAEDPEDPTTIKKHKSHDAKLKPFSCSQCGKLCTGTTDRENGSCLHHPGNLQVDEEVDFWADEDEDVHERIDTTERRCEFPEGFYWTCCGNSGTSRGCVISGHGDVGRRHLARLRGAGYPR